MTDADEAGELRRRLKEAQHELEAAQAKILELCRANVDVGLINVGLQMCLRELRQEMEEPRASLQRWIDRIDQDLREIGEPP